MKLFKLNQKRGLGFLLALFLMGLLFLVPGRALAAPSPDQVKQCVNNLKFQDIAHITCEVSGLKITFVDKNPTDNLNYEKGDYTASSSSSWASESSSNAFCQKNTDSITFTGRSGSGSNFDLSDAGQKHKASVSVFYVQDGHSGCQEYTKTFDMSNTGNINVLLNGDDDSAKSVPDISSSSHSLYGLGYSRYKNGSFDPSDNVALYSDSADLNNCSGSLLAVYVSKSGTGSTAYEYDISGSGDSLTSKQNLSKLPSNTGCGVSRVNFGLGDNAAFRIQPAVTNISKSLAGNKCDPTGTAPSGYTCQCVKNIHGADTSNCTLAPDNSNLGNTGNCDSTGDCGGNGSAACAFQTNGDNLDVALEWIICPVITGLSKTADAINGFVEGQLNFDVDNLTGADNNSVQRAWAVFKDMVSALIVVIMLVMVLSQAVSWGPFDAYTIKKLLPKLVIAIILMQVSWYICIYLITLANDAGQGIAGLMAAPFGGAGNLDLPSLLHRLNPVAAAAVGISSTGLTLTAAIFGGGLLAWGWPVLVLAAILLVISLIVGLATLLIRNVAIVLLVIISPFAFLAWILPGTKTYWDKWKQNFTKLLLFFPMVMALIYGGRIFAWTAGGIGNSGPLDLIMIFVGFFGPYAYLPKTFKWGGTIMAQASEAINKSWPVSKGRDVARKGLMERQQRNLDERAKALDPKATWYAKRDGKFMKFLPRYKGNVAKTLIANAAAGRVIPTKRGLAAAIQRGEKWSTEEDAIAGAKIKRGQDKALSTGAVSFRLGKDANGNLVVIPDEARGTGAGKAAIFEYAGSEDERDAGMAVDRALRTSSWVEIGKNLVPVTDENLKTRIKASGAEVFENLDEQALDSVLDALGYKGEEKDVMRGRYKNAAFVRMYDLPRYVSKVNSSEELYPMTLGKFAVATPHITDAENPNMSPSVTRSLQEEENMRARQEGRQPETIPTIPHHIARAIETIRGGYIDEGNIGNQSEAEIKEFARLAAQPEGHYLANEFASLLERMADGSPGGLNTLSALASNASLAKTIDEVLKSGKGIAHPDLSAYVQAARAAVNAPQPAQAAPAQPAAAPITTQQTIQTTQQRGPGGAVILGQGAQQQPGTQGPQQPVVVNIDHEAIGEAFASHMRNVLQHTTLKVEHSGEAGTGPSTARFEHHEDEDEDEGGAPHE